MLRGRVRPRGGRGSSIRPFSVGDTLLPFNSPSRPGRRRDLDGTTKLRRPDSRHPADARIRSASRPFRSRCFGQDRRDFRASRRLRESGRALRQHSAQGHDERRNRRLCWRVPHRWSPKASLWIELEGYRPCFIEPRHLVAFLGPDTIMAYPGGGDLSVSDALTEIYTRDRNPEPRSAQVAWAQTGSIAGLVLDERGVPVAYANVLLKNTQRGGRADAQGSYRIPNVPVGTYTVATRILGYAADERTNVLVRNGERTTVDFKIKEVPVGIIAGPTFAPPPPNHWVPPCPSHRVDTNSWKRVDTPQFSFLMPPGFHEVKARGIEPEKRNFTVGDSACSFTVYWGTYSDPLSKSPSYFRYATCSEWIGGKKANLMTALKFSEPSSGYIAAAAWRDVTPDLNLTIQGVARDRQGLEALLAVLRSVRFEEE